MLNNKPINIIPLTPKQIEIVERYMPDTVDYVSYIRTIDYSEPEEDKSTIYLRFHHTSGDHYGVSSNVNVGSTKIEDFLSVYMYIEGVESIVLDGLCITLNINTLDT